MRRKRAAAAPQTNIAKIGEKTYEGPPVTNEDDRALEGPFHGPLSGMRGVYADTGLCSMLDSIEARLERKQNCGLTQRRGEGYREEVDKVLDAVRTLRYVMESPAAAQAAAIAMDIGGALQRLGVWDDIDGGAGNPRRNGTAGGRRAACAKCRPAPPPSASCPGGGDVTVGPPLIEREPADQIIVGGGGTRLNDALSAKYQVILPLVNARSQRDVSESYEIAGHFEQVRIGDGEGGTCGKNAVANLAEALGWGATTIYDHASVVKTWSNLETFTAIAKRKNIFNQPMSWSHFVVLAAVADDEHRQWLIEETLKHGWSTRELERMKQPKQKPLKKPQPQEAAKGSAVPVDPIKEEKPADPAVEPKTPRSLAVAIQNFLAQIDALKKNTYAFGAQLSKEILDADLPDAELQRLKQARQNLEDLFPSIIKSLGDWIADRERRREAPARSQDEWEDSPEGGPGVGSNDKHPERAAEAVVGAA